MTEKFDSFVVFAEMRTGSNFLEANLNAFEGISCHGEAFNPFFMGYPKSEPILGGAWRVSQGAASRGQSCGEALDLVCGKDRDAILRQ